MHAQQHDIERAPTGLEGLDRILGGGFPRGWIHLLRGMPGTGKTTLSLQFLLEGVARGERTLLVALSETEQEIRAMARSHGWSLDGLRIYELSAAEEMLGLTARQTIFHPSEVELTEVANRLMELLEETGAERVVFDSVAELKMLAGDPGAYRQQILRLKKIVDRTGATIVLVEEARPDRLHTGTETLCNTVILLTQRAPAFGSVRRQLRIVKTRGTGFRSGHHDMDLDFGGIRVFPRISDRGPHDRMMTEQLSSGVPALDRMLGGGPYLGTSTLLLGPSGVGKSTVAIRYAVTAAERGERSVLYLFEERQTTLYRRAEQMGMDLSPHVDADRIVIRRLDPIGISPGEFAHDVDERVNAGVRIVVIDSLNGYLRSAGSRNSPYLDQLRGLLGYLGGRGVSTLLIMAQHGLFQSDRAALDLSYLADSVLLFRYFELDGEVRKAVSVFKRRGGAHERAIREIELGPSGIRLSEPLQDFHGVLTGVPIYDEGGTGE